MIVKNQVYVCMFDRSAELGWQLRVSINKKRYYDIMNTINVDETIPHTFNI